MLCALTTTEYKKTVECFMFSQNVIKYVCLFTDFLLRIYIIRAHHKSSSFFGRVALSGPCDTMRMENSSDIHSPLVPDNTHNDPSHGVSYKSAAVAASTAK